MSADKDVHFAGFGGGNNIFLLFIGSKAREFFYPHRPVGEAITEVL